MLVCELESSKAEHQVVITCKAKESRQYGAVKTLGRLAIADPKLRCLDHIASFSNAIRQFAAHKAMLRSQATRLASPWLARGMASKV